MFEASGNLGFGDIPHIHRFVAQVSTMNESFLLSHEFDKMMTPTLWLLKTNTENIHFCRLLMEVPMGEGEFPTVGLLRCIEACYFGLQYSHQC